MKIETIRVETILAEQKLTRKQFAERCGISRQSISTILRRGTCEPRTAGRLAEGLGVSVSDIIAKGE